MATPTYLGAAQPQPSSGNGLFALIGSYLGGGSGTPAYRGVGQPAPVFTGGLLRPSTPIYAAAPVREQVTQGSAEAEAIAQAEAACPIDAEALASGHIAIVIPRGT